LINLFGPDSNTKHSPNTVFFLLSIKPLFSQKLEIKLALGTIFNLEHIKCLQDTVPRRTLLDSYCSHTERRIKDTLGVL
jgi:hypothetical protein